jgi:hypothetical protein
MFLILLIDEEVHDFFLQNAVFYVELLENLKDIIRNRK